MTLKIKLFGYDLQFFTSDYRSKIEELAGDMIEQEQIQRCLIGKSYWVYSDDGKEEWLEAVEEEEFSFYFNLFDTIQMLGLPHGRGWINEQEWVIFLYRSFKKEYDSVINVLQAKAIKDGENKT